MLYEQKNEKLSQLIVAVASGAVNALDEIYRLTGKVLTATAYSILRNRMDAEDIVHDVMVQLVRKAKKFYYNKNALGWLCTMTKNAALSKCRQKRSRKEEPIETFRELSYVHEDDFIVEEIFDRLEDGEADLIRMKYWYGMSIAQIAETIKRFKSTTAYRIKRVEEKIQKFYK